MKNEPTKPKADIKMYRKNSKWRKVVTHIVLSGLADFVKKWV